MFSLIKKFCKKFCCYKKNHLFSYKNTDRYYFYDLHQDYTLFGTNDL